MRYLKTMEDEEMEAEVDSLAEVEGFVLKSL